MRDKKQIGPFTIHGDRGRSKDQFMGRFGGGWQYKLGITAGTFRNGQITVLVGLWSREYRVVFRTKKRRVKDAMENVVKTAREMGTVRSHGRGSAREWGESDEEYEKRTGPVYGPEVLRGRSRD